ncbi:MAG: rhodanese-like domain-containing protein [Bacteroidota bacterium]
MNQVQSKPFGVNSPVLTNDYIIVDVRTPMEFFHGHIEGAKNVPIEMIDEWFETFARCNKPIIICAGWGSRSARACEKLRSRGVKTIDGGDWELLAERIHK